MVAAAAQSLGLWLNEADCGVRDRDEQLFREDCSSIASPSQPPFKHKLTKEPLWTDSPHNPYLITNGAAVERFIGAENTRDVLIMEEHSNHSHILGGAKTYIELNRKVVPKKHHSDDLVTMHAKRGELQKAHELLNMHNSSSIVPWNALIGSYAREGQGKSALDCFEQMRQRGFLPNAVTYVCILKACAAIGAIEKGKQIHEDILGQGLLEHNVVLGGALVDMYAKCGALHQAHRVLEKLPCRNVISWSALIAGYVQKGQGQQALESFEQMQHEGIQPNAVTYVSVLKACAVIGAIDKGKDIHDEIVRQGLLMHSKVLCGALVDMYAKCGAFVEAQRALEKLPFCDVAPWNALITGYAEKGKIQEALDCFEEMRLKNVFPNAATYVCILKACGSMGAIDKGKQIHDEISRRGLLEQSVVLGGALVDMYAKCGALFQAQSVLEKLPSRNAISWNALIAGYAQKGQGQKALHCYKQMQHEGIHPTAVTYLCTLKACAVIGAIDKGKEIHDEISMQGLLEHDTMLGGALVDMYAKCGDLAEAQSVLQKLPSRDVVSWNALIVGFAQKGEGQKAIECCELMQQEGIRPDAGIYACILKACAVTGALDKGKQIHDEILQQGLLEHNVVLGGALVDMYAKCGALSQAQSVLEKLPSRKVVSWSALIAGYAQEGQGQQALECFEEMRNEGIPPDALTYVSILKACASIGAVDKGREIHNEISSLGLLKDDIVLGNALVDMYAKCGALPQAQSVLDKLPSRDVILWNVLIAGYAQEGQGVQALKCLEQMHHEGILPDMTTFSCLLNLCSHLGLVEKGQKLFDDMEAVYGMKPDIYCFTCMIDLLGRAGHLVKAVEVIHKMPFPADSGIWLCLLGACLEWVDVKVGILAFEQAVKLDRCDGAAYILMANLYALANMPEKAKAIGAMRIRYKLQNQTGYPSLANFNPKGPLFSTEETVHAQIKDTKSDFNEIGSKLADEDDCQHFNWMLEDMSDASKYYLLSNDSEKLGSVCPLVDISQGCYSQHEEYDYADYW